MNFLNVDIPVKNVPELDKGFVPLGPVSYTHLDVYKRQALRTLNHAKPQQVRFC